LICDGGFDGDAERRMSDERDTRQRPKGGARHACRLSTRPHGIRHGGPRRHNRNAARLSPCGTGDGRSRPRVLQSERYRHYAADYWGRTSSNRHIEKSPARRAGPLRDFIRNVVVNEFDGPEPSPSILDAIVAYIEDIDFLPNLNLAVGGRLGTRANDAQRHGETLFFTPFPHNPELSCAACHIPSSGFVDHRQHSVGSGGLFKTPTLINANFNAPYFHDGRYDTYDQVVGHFDRTFELGLSPGDRADLVAYLQAIGDGLVPYERDGVTASSRKSTISPVSSTPRFRPTTTMS
jgi:hypothetical protein